MDKMCSDGVWRRRMPPSRHKSKQNFLKMRKFLSGEWACGRGEWREERGEWACGIGKRDDVTGGWGITGGTELFFSPFSCFRKSTLHFCRTALSTLLSPLSSSAGPLSTLLSPLSSQKVPACCVSPPGGTIVPSRWDDCFLPTVRLSRPDGTRSGRRAGTCFAAWAVLFGAGRPALGR